MVKIALLLDDDNFYFRELNDVFKKVSSYGEIELSEIYSEREINFNDDRFKAIKTREDIGSDIDISSRLTEIICSPKYSNIGLVAIGTNNYEDFECVSKLAKKYSKNLLRITSDRENRLYFNLEENSVIKFRDWEKIPSGF